MARAFRFLRRERPDVLVLQWWTGTVLHSYLALALAARMLGIRIVVELHEAQDVGEAAIPVVGRYVRWLAPQLFAMADRYVVHSEFDRELVSRHYGLALDDIEIIPHAAYEQYGTPAEAEEAPAADGPCRLLYFGVIRPFKGVEDLVRAFDALPEDEASRYTLTIVGETWEGHTLPGELVAASRYRDRISFVNRYVEDDEVEGLFADADVVVLPYHRSSQSGPLHVAMAHGLPVVVTAVGGLVEATSGYDGAVLVQPQDPRSLLDGIRRAETLRGRRFAVPHSWEASAASFAALARRLLDRPAAAPAARPAIDTAE